MLTPLPAIWNTATSPAGMLSYTLNVMPLERSQSTSPRMLLATIETIAGLGYWASCVVPLRGPH